MYAVHHTKVKDLLDLIKAGDFILSKEGIVALLEPQGSACSGFKIAHAFVKTQVSIYTKSSLNKALNKAAEFHSGAQEPVHVQQI